MQISSITILSIALCVIFFIIASCIIAGVFNRKRERKRMSELEASIATDTYKIKQELKSLKKQITMFENTSYKEFINALNELKNKYQHIDKDDFNALINKILLGKEEDDEW